VMAALHGSKSTVASLTTACLSEQHFFFFFFFADWSLFLSSFVNR
jgi:hypothetical protein